MATLLIADHDNIHINDATLKTVSAAQQLGAPVTLLVAGASVAILAAEAAKIDGVATVLVADDASLAHMLAEPMAALIVSLSDRFTHFMAPATANGKNIMPRVAALLDVMQISDVLTILSPDTFERPIYAGNAIQTVQSQDAKKVMTIRTAGFKAAAYGGAASVETMSVHEAVSISAFKSEEVSNLHPLKLLCQAGELWHHQKISKRLLSLWRISLGRHWVRAAQPLMQAMPQMIGKWGKRAKLLRPIFILLAEFQAQSNIWQA
jgi:electron transfer flavoprotein alpha subunit